MEYQEFKMMMKERIQKMMGDSIEVTIETYYKNNQTRIESLSFREKAPANPMAIAPAINIKDLYKLFQQYGDGGELEDCLCIIKKLYDKQEPKAVKSIMVNWGSVKDRVFMTLVNKDLNKELLNSGGWIYKEIVDFAIILRLKVPCAGSQIVGTTEITQGILALWGIDEETLWQAAEYNLHQEVFDIKSLNETVFEATEEMYDKNEVSSQTDDKDSEPLKLLPNIETHYVMSNKDRNYGAIAMLRTDLLQEFAEKNGSNLFILPSSIHEIMLVLDNGIYTVEELRNMVRSVNESMVEDIDKLSDEVYYFRRGSNSVQKAEEKDFLI